jgi:hypothetical protein
MTIHIFIIFFFAGPAVSGAKFAICPILFEEKAGNRDISPFVVVRKIGNSQKTEYHGRLAVI